MHMADSEPVRPALDDAYWFAQSKQMVERAISSRNEQAGKFATWLGWLWTIYTAGTTVGLTLGKTKYSFGATLLIASPSLILIIAYWQAVQAQTPTHTDFDLRSPTEIQEAYNRSVKQKEELLKLARRWSFAAAFAIGIAMVAASWAKPVEKPMEKQAASPELAAQRKGSLLTVWGRGVACDTFITVDVSKSSGSPAPIEKIIPCSHNGEFGTEFELKPESEWKGTVVEIKWTDPKDKDVSHAVTREIH
jgi:hypothetical protein